MRWTATAPVTWPTQQGWDVWWAGVLAEEFAGSLGGDGSGPPLGAAGQVQLVAGQHLQPGAIYRLGMPEGVSVGQAAAGIGGRPDRRDLYLEYQETASARRRVEVRLDGLDACSSLEATSTLKHLGAEVSFRPERDRLLDAEVRLDWLLVRLRARVVPAQEGEQLRVRLRIVGRGVWRPVIAPLLVPIGVALRHLVQAETTEAADRMTHLEEDPRGDGAPERELARISRGAELMRERLHEVVRTVDARPFWKGRGGHALREAFDALPALGEQWPNVTPATAFGASGRWWDEEEWLFKTIFEPNPWRRTRHREVDRAVDTWLGHQVDMVELRARSKQELQEAEAPLADRDSASAAEIEEMLDLSWLATPWSTVRFLARKAREDSPEDPDQPTLDTDEDVQRFVTQMLKEW